MKALILAAGYATRLYPLTLDRPKALLPVGGKPMLDHLMEQLEQVEGLDEVYVVTNSKFAEAFREWAAARSGLPLRIIDDGTVDDDSKLGAIGDLDLTIREAELDDDLIVLAGDNLFSESIAPFPVFALRKGGPALGVYDVGDLDTIRRYSVIELDDDDRVTRLEAGLCQRGDQAPRVGVDIRVGAVPRPRLGPDVYRRRGRRVAGVADRRAAHPPVGDGGVRRGGGQGGAGLR